MTRIALILAVLTSLAATLAPAPFAPSRDFPGVYHRLKTIDPHKRIPEPPPIPGRITPR